MCTICRYIVPVLDLLSGSDNRSIGYMRVLNIELYCYLDLRSIDTACESTVTDTWNWWWQKPSAQRAYTRVDEVIHIHNSPCDSCRPARQSALFNIVKASPPGENYSVPGKLIYAWMRCCAVVAVSANEHAQMAHVHAMCSAARDLNAGQLGWEMGQCCKRVGAQLSWPELHFVGIG